MPAPLNDMIRIKEDLALKVADLEEKKRLETKIRKLVSELEGKLEDLEKAKKICGASVNEYMAGTISVNTVLNHLDTNSESSRTIKDSLSEAMKKAREAQRNVIDAKRDITEIKATMWNLVAESEIKEIMPTIEKVYVAVTTGFAIKNEFEPDNHSYSALEHFFREKLSDYFKLKSEMLRAVRTELAESYSINGV